MAVKIKSLYKTHNPVRFEPTGTTYRKYMEDKSIKENLQLVDGLDRQQIATESHRIAAHHAKNKVAFERASGVAINRIIQEGKDILFKDLFSTLVIESLYLDEEKISEFRSSIKEVAESYIEEEGGYQFLLNAIKENSDITVLQLMRDVCEATVKTVAARKRRELEKGKDDLDPANFTFDMTDDEKEQYDYKKTEMSLPEISAIIKDRVLTVVKDEKQRAKEQKDLQDAIEAEVAEELSSTNDKEATEENFTAILESRIISRPIREESTLYNSIIRNTLTSIVKESYDSDEAVEMDMVLSESMLQYTIMECAESIGLTEYSIKELQQMSQALLQ